MSSQLTRGIVRKVLDRGFGFIQPKSSHPEIFFHSTQCLTPFDSLKEGHEVQFEITDSPKGKRAVNVERV